jgi:hypothetical protein
MGQMSVRNECVKGLQGHAHLAIVGVIDRKTTDELSVLIAGDFELALELE